MMPTAYMPQGKLGAHRHGEKLIQVQTEFATRPRPRVTSTIVVDGRTVHKTDREWTLELDHEENRLELEIALDEQHRATMAMVVDRAAELVEQARPTPTPGGEGFPDATFRETIEEVLRSVPYVMAFYEFDQNGEVIYRRRFRDVVADWDREFEALSAVVFGLPQIIKVGDFQQGIVYFGAENLISARIRDRAFGILTDPEATIEHLRRDFPEFFEAVYHANDPV